MTTRELIEVLSKLDPDAVVHRLNDGDLWVRVDSAWQIEFPDSFVFPKMVIID